MAEEQITLDLTTSVNFTFEEMIELKFILSLRKESLEKQLAGLPEELATTREVVEDWLTKTNTLIKTVEQADKESILHPRLEVSAQ